MRRKKKIPEPAILVALDQDGLTFNLGRQVTIPWSSIKGMFSCAASCHTEGFRGIRAPCLESDMRNLLEEEEQWRKRAVN